MVSLAAFVWSSRESTDAIIPIEDGRNPPEDRQWAELAQPEAMDRNSGDKLDGLPANPTQKKNEDSLEYGSLRGHILTHEGEPVGNLSIRLSGENATLSRRSDASGAIVFKRLPVGRYQGHIEWQDSGSLSTSALPEGVTVSKGQTIHDFYIPSSRQWVLLRLTDDVPSSTHIESLDAGITWKFSLSPTNQPNVVLSGQALISSKKDHLNLIEREKRNSRPALNKNEPEDKAQTQWLANAAERLNSIDYTGGVLIPIANLAPGNYRLAVSLGGVTSPDRSVDIPVTYAVDFPVGDDRGMEDSNLLDFPISVDDLYSAAIKRLPR